MSIPVKDSTYFIYNENLDPTIRDGALIDVTLNLKRWGQLSGGISYVNAKFDSGTYQGKDIPFVAKNSYHLAENFTWCEYWHLIVEDIYTGSRYPINDVENRTTALGGFSIYNCSLSYAASHYTISWRINNITNKHYYNNVVATYMGGQSAELYYYPAAGINTLLSVSFKL